MLFLINARVYLSVTIIPEANIKFNLHLPKALRPSLCLIYIYVLYIRTDRIIDYPSHNLNPSVSMATGHLENNNDQ